MTDGTTGTTVARVAVLVIGMIVAAVMMTTIAGVLVTAMIEDAMTIARVGEVVVMTIAGGMIGVGVVMIVLAGVAAMTSMTRSRSDL